MIMAIIMVGFVYLCMFVSERERERGKEKVEIEMQNRIVVHKTSRRRVYGSVLEGVTYSPNIIAVSPSSRKNRIHHLQFGQDCCYLLL